jgi:hypothetical protein
MSRYVLLVRAMKNPIRKRRQRWKSRASAPLRFDVPDVCPRGRTGTVNERGCVLCCKLVLSGGVWECREK